MTALLCGIWPALEFSKADVRGALMAAAPKASLSAARRRGLNALVVGEVALALVLLSASGVVLKAFYRVLNTDPGFAARRAITFGVNPPYQDPEKRGIYFRRMHEALMKRRRGSKRWRNRTCLRWAMAVPERGTFPIRVEGAALLRPDESPRAEHRRGDAGIFSHHGDRGQGGARVRRAR